MSYVWSGLWIHGDCFILSLYRTAVCERALDLISKCNNGYACALVFPILRIPSHSDWVLSASWWEGAPWQSFWKPWEVVRFGRHLRGGGADSIEAISRSSSFQQGQQGVSCSVLWSPCEGPPCLRDAGSIQAACHRGERLHQGLLGTGCRVGLPLQLATWCQRRAMLGKLYTKCCRQQSGPWKEAVVSPKGVWLVWGWPIESQMDHFRFILVSNSSIRKYYLVFSCLCTLEIPIELQ